MLSELLSLYSLLPQTVSGSFGLATVAQTYDVFQVAGLADWICAHRSRALADIDTEFLAGLVFLVEFPLGVLVSC